MLEGFRAFGFAFRVVPMAQQKAAWEYRPSLLNASASSRSTSAVHVARARRQ